MSDALRVAKNATILISAQVFNLALSFVVAIMIARAFGAGLYGEYSFADIFTTIFATFSDLGYGNLLFREVSKNKSNVDKYLNNVLSINLVTSIIVFGVMVASSRLMNHPKDTMLIVSIFGVYALITTTSGLFKIIFRSFERMEYEAFVKISTNIVRAALVVSSIYMGYGLIGVAISSLLSAVFNLSLSYAICKVKFTKVKLELDRDFIRSTKGAAISLGMLSLFTIMYTRIDTLLLSSMKGNEAVGLYNAAYDLIVYMRVIPDLFLIALFPTALGALANSKQMFYSYYNRVVRYLIAIGIPTAICICLLSEEIINLLYGTPFAESKLILQILSFSALLMFTYIALGNALISLGKEREVAISALICTCSNITLSIILIPRLGTAGAALATILGELMLLSCYCYLIRKYLNTIPLHRHAIRPVMASIPMACFALYGIHYHGILEVAIVSIVIYSLAFLFLGGLDYEDRKLILKSVGYLKPLVKGYLLEHWLRNLYIYACQK